MSKNSPKRGGSRLPSDGSISPHEVSPAIRGNVEAGNSGGPVVNSDGKVIATIFGARQGSDDGYAVPNEKVSNALANVGPPLETACVAR